MIIDGRKVLYKMRNGKIVDSNIPTAGLVCYLDTRGKTNMDKHRGTLIDLSGNGNHVTLQNFGFNEKSGYVKDLSGGGTSGLKFDGLDDYFKLELSNSIGDLTFMLNAKIMAKIALKTNPFYIDNGLFLMYKPIGYEVFSIGLRLKSGSMHRKNLGTLTDSVIVSRKNDTKSVYINGNKTDVQTITDPQKIFYVGSSKSLTNFAYMNLDKIAIWNRALTDKEIQQLMEV